MLVIFFTRRLGILQLHVIRYAIFIFSNFASLLAGGPLFFFWKRVCQFRVPDHGGLGMEEVLEVDGLGMEEVPDHGGLGMEEVHDHGGLSM